MATRLDDREVLHAILRTDFLSFVQKVFQTLCPGQTFVPGWHLKAMAYQLERVRRGEIRRLVINAPPRSLKSIVTSVALPAFILGHDPTQRILCASYSNELARKHSNDFRVVLNSAWYQALFPGARISPYKDTETEIELTARGFRLATSVTGTLTGRGGNTIIIDDPLKPIDALSGVKRNTVNEWFANTVLSRQDDKRVGAIVLVMQRVHTDDLTGFLLRSSDEWEILKLIAIAESFEAIPIGPGKAHYRRPGEVLSPQREPMEILNALRLQLGSDLFSAQYQQAPVPPGGAMIKRLWVKRYAGMPQEGSRRFIIQSWDTAAKGGPDNDWSVCTTWLHPAEGKWYLLDLWRGRVDYPTLKSKVECLAKQWRADEVLIEESGTALALIDELRFRIGGLIGVKPERDKETRMSVASAKLEAGQVFLPERALWLPELEEELFSFPGSRHDDQVDSISQALNHDKSSLWVWSRL
jgi:predicted phage terminase large subunit-like protein